jgi:hypothetical protein
LNHTSAVSGGSFTQKLRSYTTLTSEAPWPFIAASKTAAPSGVSSMAKVATLVP